MMHNDNIRDILAWELPEINLGSCLVCGQLNELDKDGLCDECELVLSDAIYRLQHPEEI